MPPQLFPSRINQGGCDRSLEGQNQETRECKYVLIVDNNDEKMCISINCIGGF